MNINRLCILIFLTFINQYANSDNHHNQIYNAVIEYEQSKTRNLIGVKSLYGIHLKNSNTIFTSIQGYLDNNKTYEINIGLGTRYFQKNAIIGIYLFFDHLKNQLNITLQQICFGIELVTIYQELRCNIYIPISKEKNILSINDRIVYTNNQQEYITVKYGYQVCDPMSGVDIEYGITNYNNNNISYFIGWHYFYSAKNNNKIIGINNKIKIALSECISSYIIFGYNNKKYWSLSTGLAIQITSLPYSNKLMSKISNHPVRDRDIIYDITKQYNFFDHRSVKL